MAKEAVLAGELDRLDNAGVVAPCQDSCGWDISCEQIPGPTNILGAPGTESIAAEAVNKHNTVQGSIGRCEVREAVRQLTQLRQELGRSTIL